MVIQKTIGAADFVDDTQSEDLEFLLNTPKSEMIVQSICHSYCNHPGHFIASAISMLEAENFSSAACDGIFSALDVFVGNLLLSCPRFRTYCAERRQEFASIEGRCSSVGALRFEEAIALHKERDAVFVDSHEPYGPWKRKEPIRRYEGRGEKLIWFYALSKKREEISEGVVALKSRPLMLYMIPRMYACVCVKSFVVDPPTLPHKGPNTVPFSIPCDPPALWNGGKIPRGIQEGYEWEAGYVGVSPLGHILVLRSEGGQAYRLDILNAEELKMFFGYDPVTDVPVIHLVDLQEEAVVMVISSVHFREFSGLLTLLSSFAETLILPTSSQDSLKPLSPESFCSLSGMSLYGLMELPIAPFLQPSLDEAFENAFLFRPSCRRPSVTVILMDDDFRPSDPLSPLMTPKDFVVSGDFRARVGVLFGNTYLEWTRDSVVMTKKIVLHWKHHNSSGDMGEDLFRVMGYISQLYAEGSESNVHPSWALFVPSFLRFAEIEDDYRSTLARLSALCCLYNRSCVFGPDDFVPKGSPRRNVRVRSSLGFVEDVLGFLVGTDHWEKHYFGHGDWYAGEKNFDLFWHLLRKNGSAPLVHHPSLREIDRGLSEDTLKLATHEEFDTRFMQSSECKSRRSELLHTLFWFRRVRFPEKSEYISAPGGTTVETFGWGGCGRDSLCNFVLPKSVAKYSQDFHPRSSWDSLIGRLHSEFVSLGGSSTGRSIAEEEEEETGECDQ